MISVYPDSVPTPFLSINHQIPQPPTPPEGYVSDGRVQFQFRAYGILRTPITEFGKKFAEQFEIYVDYYRPENPADKIRTLWDGEKWSEWYPC